MADVQLPCLERPLPLHVAVPAAKLHVLHLEPIKARVGEKWPRLSQLVHALFEKALRRVQGPHDRFIQIDELSYIATFEGRTIEEAAVSCTAVAQEVCDLLFGEESHAVSLRSLVGMVPEGDIEPHLHSGAIIEALEKHGTERIITRRSKAERGAEAQMGLAGAHRLLGEYGCSARFFPLWDMARQTGNCLLLQPVGGRSGTHASTVRRLLRHAGEEPVTDLEIALLSAACEYAHRIHDAHKLCAIGAGVGWETLSVAVTRARYLAALKEVTGNFPVPLMLKIEDVPFGMPAPRLGELVTMLSAHHAKVLVEFEFGTRLPDPPFKLGAAGIGTTLPDYCDAELAQAIIDKLNRRAEKQKCFTFLGGIGEGLAAGLKGLRFGSGPGLDGIHHYTGLEGVPDFPLQPGGAIHYL